MYRISIQSLSFLLAILFVAFTSAKAKRPNVILIMTDDQGIGDLACHGNPWIQTPHLDALYAESVRMTDFHVSPVCTPTRAALMTGRYPINNGAWATYKGRDALPEDSFTLADLFKQNGYRTALFGKWHLGDNFPSRATDSGFEYVVQHKAGGVGELSDYWGNTYFDDVYYVNNEPRQFEGYCTDVWFQEAIDFIERNKENPFFVYLPTNAPHSPWYVDEQYAAPYRDLAKQNKIVSAEFYGMITNFDENLGSLNQYLEKSGLADNTILIFLTDNGSSGGISRDGKIGYNKGFRGRKGDKTEGGHRVPFFIRWKNGNVYGGHDNDALAAHVDLLPTLASLCQLESTDSLSLDGSDFSTALVQEVHDWKRDTVFIHHRQDWRPPMDTDQTCIALDHWRLVNGKELYDVADDPMQLNDVASQHPELVTELLKQNATFVARAKEKADYAELPSTVVGHPAQREVKLTIQHAVGEDNGIWKSEQVAAGMKNTNNRHALRIAKTGTYEISCRRWPKECPGPIWGIPEENPKNWFDYQSIAPEKARIQIANQIHEKSIHPDDHEVVFHLHLDAGKTILVNDFIENGEAYGVYYTYISPTD